MSASAAIGPLALLGRQYDGYLSFPSQWGAMTACQFRLPPVSTLDGPTRHLRLLTEKTGQLWRLLTGKSSVSMPPQKGHEAEWLAEHLKADGGKRDIATGLGDGADEDKTPQWFAHDTGHHREWIPDDWHPTQQ